MNSHVSEVVCIWRMKRLDLTSWWWSTQFIFLVVVNVDITVAWSLFEWFVPMLFVWKVMQSNSRMLPAFMLQVFQHGLHEKMHSKLLPISHGLPLTNFIANLMQNCGVKFSRTDGLNGFQLVDNIQFCLCLVVLQKESGTIFIYLLISY